jgi:Tfp pilus assembly protein PilN
MSWQAPNLATEPFENLRPVRRISGLLLLAALALTAWNVGTWLRAGSGIAARTAELDRLESETAQSRARIATLDQNLAAADIEGANREAEFLNQRIAERTFSWNLLLDRLVDTLPAGVRLRQLAPTSQRNGSTSLRTRSAEPGGETVTLSISGEAQDDDALLELVDHLFADPGFLHPNLARESETNAGLVQFNLTVDYRPEEPGTASAATGSDQENAGAPDAGAPGAEPAAAATPATAPATGPPEPGVTRPETAAPAKGAPPAAAPGGGGEP